MIGVPTAIAIALSDISRQRLHASCVFELDQPGWWLRFG